MTGDRNITLSDINEISDALRFVRCYSRILRQLILDTAGNDEEGEAAASRHATRRSCRAAEHGLA